jgi:hypothetical protein
MLAAGSAPQLQSSQNVLKHPDSQLLIHHRRRIGKDRGFGGALEGLEEKIVKNICRGGSLQRRCDVGQIEEAQNIIFDVHSRGIEAEREISPQSSKLPVLLDPRQNGTNSVGITRGVPIVELLLSERESI